MAKIPSLSRRSEPVQPQDENGDGRVDERDKAVADERATSTTHRDTGTAGERPAGRLAAAFGNARASMSRPSSGSGAAPAVAPDQAEETTTYRSRAATTPPAPAPVRTDRDSTSTPTDPVTTSAPVTREPVTRSEPVAVPATNQTVDDRTGTDRTGTDRPETRTDTRPDPEPRVATPPAGPRPRASVLATLSLIVGVAAALFVLTGTLAGYGIGLGVLALLLAIGGISATSKRHVAGKSDALFGLLLGLGAIVVGVLAMTGQFSWPSTDGTVEQFRQWLDSQFVDRF